MPLSPGETRPCRPLHPLEAHTGYTRSGFPQAIDADLSQAVNMTVGGRPIPKESSMATKANFAPDEWKTLLQSPLIVGIAVSAADPSGLLGMLKESMASARALLPAEADPNADELVKAVAGDFETSEGRPLAQEGVKAMLAGGQARRHQDQNRRCAQSALDASRRQSPRRCFGLQDLARGGGESSGGSRPGGRLSRLRRHAGQRRRKGDAGRNLGGARGLAGKTSHSFPTLPGASCGKRMCASNRRAPSRVDLTRSAGRQG